MKFMYKGQFGWREKEDVNKLTRYVNDRLCNYCRFVKTVTITKNEHFSNKKGWTSFITVDYNFMNKELHLPCFFRMIIRFKVKFYKMRVRDIYQRDGSKRMGAQLKFVLK